MSASTNIHNVTRIQVLKKGKLNGFPDTQTTDIIFTDQDGYRITVTAFHDPSLTIEGDNQ